MVQYIKQVQTSFFRRVIMASRTDIIRSWISGAIAELFAKEYLLDNLDWDVKGYK